MNPGSAEPSATGVGPRRIEGDDAPSHEPEVASAVRDLTKRGLLPEATGERLLRVARGELLSVRLELRALLYLGVLLLTSGVGLFLKENLDRIGPLGIAVAIAIPAAAALVWVARTSLPFSWREVPSPNLAFDYILLLSVLLTAVDLAYVEAEFTPLGANWPWHLLIMSMYMLAVAARFDSRVLFSLALSTFAAWRGVAVGALGSDLLWNRETAVRANALVCGALFVASGALLTRVDKKAHFEPVAVHVGWILVLGALASGMASPPLPLGEGQGEGPLLHATILLITSVLLAARTFALRRFSLFAFGVVGAYAGLSRLALHVTESDWVRLLWFAGSALAVIIALLKAHRTMRPERES